MGIGLPGGSRAATVVATAVIAVGLMFGATTSQAATVQRDGDTATGITDLVVGGVTYDVVFTNAAGSSIYGDPPKFDFKTNAEARAAIEAAAAALTAAGGIQGASNARTPIFRIGFKIEGDGLARLVTVWEAVRGDGQSDTWAPLSDPDFFPFLDDGTYANFSTSQQPEPEPEPEPEPSPPESTDAQGFVRKQFTCPQNNVTLIPKGSRFSVADVTISTNKDQAVTLKFNPPNKVLMKLFMKAKLSFEANFSGQVESVNEQALLLDCTGSANTTLTVTITGNGNL